MYKHLIWMLVWLIGSLTTFAQSNTEKESLAKLFNAIQETPSYKNQIKGDPAYISIYQKLMASTPALTHFEEILKYYNLIAPINDNHLGLYKLADSNTKPIPLFWNPQGVKKQVVLTDTLKLKQLLGRADKSPIEGFYKSGKELMGIVKEQSLVEPNALSSLKLFALVHVPTLRVYGYFNETPSGSYDFIHLNPQNSGISVVRNRKFIDASFPQLELYQGNIPNYRKLTYELPNFEFKWLGSMGNSKNPDIGYLRLSSFLSSTKNIQEAKDFLFKNTETIKKSKYLIVDIRNNGGGGFKTSQHFINLLKAFKGQVLVLQNIYTVSNAEKFILKLKNQKNIQFLGEPTAGTIAYGSNTGKKVYLANNSIYFYPTDMKANPKELPFESKGIPPDIQLDYNDLDWIGQVTVGISFHRRGVPIPADFKFVPVLKNH